MRIKAIKATEILPVKRFEVTDISDVVVLAGANGVGKTRLVERFIKYFRSLSGSNPAFLIEATHSSERALWKKQLLDTAVPQDVDLLRQTLQQTRRRGNLLSSVLYFESDRSIQQVKPYQFTWDIPDPWEETVAWDVGFAGLRNRFQDTLHSIFKKIQNQRNSIASRAQQLRKQGHKSMNLDFQDPLEPFKMAFSQLLGPKVLEGADIINQTLHYSLDGQVFNITSLSSGEHEVLNITFDFILRRPGHCIIFFDEPELHLHPELSSKLISTLKAIGEHNQFIFCTHSPDIISSSLDDSVIFIGPDKKNDANQAILVSPDDQTNKALRSLGHSIGIVSLGKKIVLIEGDDASLDKQTYGHILRNRFPDLVLAPSAGRHTLFSFNTILSDILDRTIWGVDFFMLCDRDAIPLNTGEDTLREDSKGRLRVLSRYHLENYFLDEHILAEVFREMEPNESWLISPERIRQEIRSIAKSRIPYATSLIVAKHIREKVGNFDIMPKGCHEKEIEDLKVLFRDKESEEMLRLQQALEGNRAENMVVETYTRLIDSINNDDDIWRGAIPGKQLFSIFCSKARIEQGRLKALYIKRALSREATPFSEIISIFDDFASM